MTCTCFSVEDRFNKRAYVLLDEALTWAEANDRCRQGDNDYLAVANNDELFNFLKGMLDAYRTQGGSANGTWIDGKFDNSTDAWNCESNSNSFAYNYEDICQPGMPWANEEPADADDSGHCVLVWHSSSDGVTNYWCNTKLPAICATKRYFICIFFSTRLHLVCLSAIFVIDV